MVLRLGLASGVVLVTLGLAEVGSRLAGPVPYRAPPEQRQDGSWHERIHRPSNVPGLSYELVPSHPSVSQGQKNRTNSLGMRDAPLRERGQRLVRIAFVGDSYTFGWAVPQGVTFVNNLERLLNQASSDPKRVFEVLNMGVSGYSTRDEAIVLREKALPLDPDLVLVGYVLNDPEIDPIQPLHASFQETELWQYSSLARRIARALYKRDLAAQGGGNYTRYLHANPRKWQSVVDAFGDMAAAAQAAGVPVAVVILPTLPRESWEGYAYEAIHGQVADAARAAGLPVIDLLSGMRRFDKPGRLRIAAADEHPNVQGHEIIGQLLFEQLKDDRALLPRGP